MVVAALLIVVVGILLFVVERSGDAAPAHHRGDPECDQALRHALKQLHDGHIDAEQYDRIAEALRR